MKVFLTLGLILGLPFANANILSPGGSLHLGQAIQSPSGKYRLIMQTDGNLVMYRSDGTVRYVMENGGWFAIMQHDGNFVEYSGTMAPRWHTNTWGNPGSHLEIQDDGNLVIYSPIKGPLWNIGIDINLQTPSKKGDVVGRDLGIPPLGSLGHIGIWNGKYVIEADSGASQAGNAIRTVLIEDYKKTTKYWGVASANIPNFWMTEYCYEKKCYYWSPPPNTWVSVSARDAIARAAQQALLIGANYTSGAFYAAPLPASESRPAQRGIFRCDTFVLYTLLFSRRYFNSYVSYNDYYLQEKWKSQLNNIGSAPITPATVFDRVKSSK